MNIAKNMEIIFVAAIAVASFTGIASAAIPAHHAGASAKVEGKMQVVTITAKRLSVAEKAALAN